MATLTVLKFQDAGGADRLLQKLQDLQKQQIITIADAATVSWPEGAKKPKTRELINTAGIGALNGAFWGMLFGLIFFVPLLGLAIGAGIGALSGAFTDIGIDENFIKRVRDEVTPGTSALFLMTISATIDKLAEELKGEKFEIISTNLSNEQEEKLREAFSAS
ncbi:MAG: DUF1269 domain-containing protein [Dehalococcoidia bacterium]